MSKPVDLNPFVSKAPCCPTQYLKASPQLGYDILDFSALVITFLFFFFFFTENWEYRDSKLINHDSPLSKGHQLSVFFHLA